MKKEGYRVSGLVTLLFVVTVILGGLHTTVIADEGMWTFDNPPVKILKEKYGFTPTQEWLDHVRLASVRFMDGGSGSFVSPNGLVMTNHHVGVGQLQKISTAERDYVATGFYAANQKDELPCADLEVNVLFSMENVTKRVMAAVKDDMNEQDALKAREAVMAEIEKESLDATGLRSNVISMYHGGEYWLYRYKKYTDVRMVFAPERQAAYFGGDFDNFTYPRYDLDVTFFRVYENDKPVNSEHYFKWNAKGAEEGDLVFVSGNPGSTDRLYTYAELEYQRDYQYPMILKYIKKRIEILRKYAEKGPEQERRALIQIFGMENANKALSGEYEGLLDEKLMEQHKIEEKKFRKRIAGAPDWQAKYGDAWDIIEKVTKDRAGLAEQRFYGRIIGSRLAGIASNIVFYVKEVEKPDSERLDGYHDSELEGFTFRTLSPAPIYLDLERANFGGGLELSRQELDDNDEFIKIVLNGRSPQEVADELINGTKLTDVEYRKSLMEGGVSAVEESDDPLIQLMLKLEPKMRADIEWAKKNIRSILTPASEKIAQARFATFGKDVYPDATFTLRLSFGTVKGYPYNGTIAPYKTTLYGLYDRAVSFEGKEEWSVPERFWERQDQLDLSTPVNFVCSCDIIGGNSGSPVINTDAEVIGLVFDGNIESLVGRFIFNEEKNRTVSVHTGYISEALRYLYDAGKLADEIEGVR